METINTPDSQENELKQFERSSHLGKVLAGLLLITIGCLIIAEKQGVIFPEWLLSWKTLLIAIGLVIGAKHRFRTAGWLLPVVIGGVFLVGDIFPELTLRHYAAPAVLIIIGLFLIFRPKSKYPRHHYYQHWKKKWAESETSGKMNPDDALEIIAIFGGAKKNVFTKTFHGGEVTCVFGGAEVNLMQADFEGAVSLEMTQVFGGAKLLVPAHWKIQSEVTAMFGSVEDKRPMSNVSIDQNKTLILTGTCIFGGLEIKSY